MRDISLPSQKWDPVYQFESGKKFKTVLNSIGLRTMPDGTRQITTGFDTAFATPEIKHPHQTPDDSDYFTILECIEMAEMMIEQWQDFANDLKEKLAD